MNNVNQIWSSRFKLYIKEMRRYLKFIFNDHLKFVLIFGLGAGAFYYQEWLSTLSAEFPTVFIIALLFAFVLTLGTIRTFFKDPDLVFLIPLEYKMKPYILKSFLFSAMIQAYIILITFGILLPLYMHEKNINFSYGLFVLICLILLKSWNVWLAWKIQYFIPSWIKASDWIVRLTVNFVAAYLLFDKASFGYVAALAAICIGLLFYYEFMVKNKKSMKWEQLIDLESSKMTTFYRIANLFTDVPHMKQKVKRRKWLDWALQVIPYKKESTFVYLYFKTFVRSNEYIGLYIRLLVLGLVALYFVDNSYGRLFIFIFVLYLTGYQLITLWRHHQSKLWIDLYPVSEEVRYKSFLQTLFILLLIKSLIFIVAIFILETFMLGLLSVVLSLLFTYLFVFTYVKQRIKVL